MEDDDEVTEDEVEDGEATPSAGRATRLLSILIVVFLCQLVATLVLYRIQRRFNDSVNTVQTRMAEHEKQLREIRDMFDRSLDSANYSMALLRESTELATQREAILAKRIRETSKTMVSALGNSQTVRDEAKKEAEALAKEIAALQQKVDADERELAPKLKELQRKMNDRG